MEGVDGFFIEADEGEYIVNAFSNKSGLEWTAICSAKDSVHHMAKCIFGIVAGEHHGGEGLIDVEDGMRMKDCWSVGFSAGKVM
jgi:hypothetical protein